MKISDLPAGPIREALTERIPEHQHDWVFGPSELFDEWLQWHGIIGWTASITEAYQTFHRTVWLVEEANHNVTTSPVGVFWTEVDADRFIRSQLIPDAFIKTEVPTK